MNELNFEKIINFRKCFDRKLESAIVSSGAMKPKSFAQVYGNILYSLEVKSLLEIGIHKGGSIRLWREFFGDDLSISCLDIKEEACDLVKGVANFVYVGSQVDSEVLSNVINDSGPFDVIIDDGSHRNQHMLKTMEMLFDHVAPGGVYIVEDMFTSYWPNYGGGLNVEGTFIEKMKENIDNIYAPFVSPKYKRQFGNNVIPTIEHSEFSKGIGSITFYPEGIVAIHKKNEL